ncbi:hypothetical protein Bhyg_09876 [Pseudolycoriella hygida]|uniref:Uncharacterized protein n=1 Tax=Pseudolycoriella hygida TaxID=35572 RepID=A0A9Q0MU77_9DIPT|nr:hypothetical protein Bhyg_09876 [Pseudolycoriella hygida]
MLQEIRSNRFFTN